MKKLIYLLAVPLLFMVSCKKEDTAKISGTYEASFIFQPNGKTSEMTFKDLQTGEIQTFTNQTAEKVFNKQVKVGDKFFLEMKGKADGLDNGYFIAVQYKGAVITKDRALGAAGIRDQVLQINKTFTEIDFKN